MTDVKLDLHMENMYMVRYGEFLFATVNPTEIVAEVWGTQFINDCPQEAWDAVDTDSIAKEKGATLCVRNGPRYWTLDLIGKDGQPDPLVMEDFQGLPMRLIASVTIPIEALNMGGYLESFVDRKAFFAWNKGRRIYELINPEGKRYVMQALSQAIDPTMNEEKLSKLGEILKMPEGWRFETRILEEQLNCDTRYEDACVLQDEFQNSYCAY